MTPSKRLCLASTATSRASFAAKVNNADGRLPAFRAGREYRSVPTPISKWADTGLVPCLNLLRLQVALQMPITDLWPPVGLKVDWVTQGVLIALLSDAEARLHRRLPEPDGARHLDSVCKEFGVAPGELASYTQPFPCQASEPGQGCGCCLGAGDTRIDHRRIVTPLQQALLDSAAFGQVDQVGAKRLKVLGQSA